MNNKNSALPSFKKSILIPLELYLARCEEKESTVAKDGQDEGERLLRQTIPVDLKMKMYDNWLANAKKHRDARQITTTNRERSNVQTMQNAGVENDDIEKKLISIPQMHDKQQQAFDESDSEITFKGFPPAPAAVVTSTPISQLEDTTSFHSYSPREKKSPVRKQRKNNKYAGERSQRFNPKFDWSSSLSDSDSERAYSGDDVGPSPPKRDRRETASYSKARVVKGMRWYNLRESPRIDKGPVTRKRSKSAPNTKWISRR